MKLQSKIPHPIPYQGSKRQIASQILAYFPPKATRLVEPFAGSAAISLAAADQRLADSFWINDAHEPLVTLWKEIVERPHELAKQYELLWHEQEGNEREFYNFVRGRFNASHQPADFLYLLARCVKAVIRYNSSGGFNNTPDNRRKGARPSEMQSRVIGAAELLAGRTELTALDYREVLAGCQDTDIIYMDPPYQGVSGERDQRYAPKITHAEFCDELAKLENQRFRFIVSYDGRTGDKEYGERIPDSLGLKHLEIRAGRSTQATLLGRSCITYESLYLSSALIKQQKQLGQCRPRQLDLV